MTASNIPTPDLAALLAPLLPALPTATVSTQPATAVLRLLSPILRQRVQVFSSSSTDPWIGLLCYDTSKAAKLKEVVQGGGLEAHPVSGEVEVDWEYGAQIRYRRLDQETLQALVAVPDLRLGFQLVYCLGDKEGGGDGWRVGEVTVVEGPSPFADFGGQESLLTAEQHYKESKAEKTQSAQTSSSRTNGTAHYLADPEDDEDDDDDYWARYDATPARTPATKRSPAPQSMQASIGDLNRSSSAEDAYFAQYDSVQPAMDNHDPDEEHNLEALDPPPGLSRPVTKPLDTVEQSELDETTGAWTLAEPLSARSLHDTGDEEHRAVVDLAHPRPASSASSSKGSSAVARLEETAERQEQNEFGVKQHVSRSIRSLFLLSRSSGIDREEFERMVRTELDLLGMIEGEED